MKAIVIRKPGSGVDAWTRIEREEPTPGAGQVLVRMRAASLNMRDLMIAKGLYGGPVGRDVVALSDGAGEVVALGAGVTRWAVGDRVTSVYYPTRQAGAMRAEDVAHQLGAFSNDGVLAQYAVLPETGIVKLPSHLSYEEASTLPCAALTAWSALFESVNRPSPGATVLVQGTGGVSIAAAQLALAAGMRVIATTSSAAKVERLRALGTTDVIDHRVQPEWHEEVLRRTGGEGADHIIEVGGGGTLERSLKAVRFGGTISVIGLLSGFGNEIDPLPILFRAAHLEGVHVGSVRGQEAMSRALELHRIHPVIDDVFPFERASDALAKLESATHFGKIVVRID